MKIITFGFIHEPPPPEATLVIDCQWLSDVAPHRPEVQAMLDQARRHAGPDAVIAFGCSFGKDRSVKLALAFAEEMEAHFVVELEHRVPPPDSW